MSKHVEINKVELADDEELQTMIKKVMDAVARSKGKTKKSLQLVGIFKDHAITRDFETGKFFKSAMTRDGEVIKLDEAVEVRQVFVPVKQKTEKAEDAKTCIAAIDGDVMTLGHDAATITEILKDLDGSAPEYAGAKEKNIWQGVI